MIHIKDSIIFDELLEHIGKQRIRAKLTDKPFELGIATDIRPSQILSLVNKDENMATLEELGMKIYKWHDDALRSNLRLAGENLMISICGTR
jgi:hypothetical protein